MCCTILVHSRGLDLLLLVCLFDLPSAHESNSLLLVQCHAELLSDCCELGCVVILSFSVNSYGFTTIGKHPRLQFCAMSV
jgi:hypothetical protein